jgi:hypothetical protein
MTDFTASVQWLTRMRMALQAARKVLGATHARLAPDFNALHFARTDEYGMSVILASLLDPSGTHGQGDTFLRSFLDQFWPSQSGGYVGAHVSVESSTEHLQHARRRLDIRIRLPGNAVLAIENKIRDAIDQDDQVKDYLAELAAESKNHLLIYLTREEGQMPCANSIGEGDCKLAHSQGRFKPLSAPQLIPWLDACIGACESDRVRAFLVELNNFMRFELMGHTNTTERELIVEAAMSSYDDAHTALQIGAAYSEIRRRLFDRFKEKLKAAITSDPSSTWSQWTVDVSENLLATGGGINLCPPNPSRYVIRLVFDSPDGRDVNVGICTVKKDGESDCEQIRPILGRSLGSGRYSEPRWPWWQPIWAGNDWGTDPDAMAAMLRDDDSGLVVRAKKVLDGIRLALDDESLRAMR